MEQRSPRYATIKRYYDMEHALYTAESIKGFVIVGWITDKEYELITGIEYVD